MVKITQPYSPSQPYTTLQACYCNCAASFILPLNMFLSASEHRVRSKTWGLSDLDPYLIANQI